MMDYTGYLLLSGLAILTIVYTSADEVSTTDVVLDMNIGNSSDVREHQSSKQNNLQTHIESDLFMTHSSYVLPTAVPIYVVETIQHSTNEAQTNATPMDMGEGHICNDSYDIRTVYTKQATLLLNITSRECTEDDCQNTSQMCYCDDVCYFYKDCCYAKMKELASGNDNDSIDFTELITHKVMKVENASLLLTRSYTGCVLDDKGDHGFVMVDKCPNESIVHVKAAENCHMFNEYSYKSIPVDYTDRNGYIVTFKNIYCAYCHGITKENLTFWTADVRCDEKNLSVSVNHGTKLDTLATLCLIKFSSPNFANYIRTCDNFLSCRVHDVNLMNPFTWDVNSDKNVLALCLTYLAPMIADQELYRNSHCAALIKKTQSVVDLRCAYIASKPREPKYLLVDLQVMFDFSLDTGIQTKVICDTKHTCASAEAYDCVSKRCKLLYCSAGFLLVNGTCWRNNTVLDIQKNSNCSIAAANISGLNDRTYFAETDQSSDLNCSITSSKDNNTNLTDFGGLPYFNCSMVAFNMSDVDIQGTKLQLLNSELILQENEFIIYDGQVFICSDMVSHAFVYGGMFEYMNNFPIMSVTTSLLSVCGIVVNIVFQCARHFPNLHSMNITALSFVILLIHTLLLSQFVINMREVCILFAVILHFLLLTMFVWMNIVGYDVARILTTNRKVSQENPLPKFGKYVILSACIPVAITIVSLSMNYLGLPYSPKYGNNGVCWLSNDGLIIFVLVPIAFSLLLNFSMFAFTVWNIHRKSSVIKMATTSGRKTYFGVYLKLMLILGFTWISGLAGAIFRVKWLWFVTIVLNGLQGISLLICSVVNAHVVGYIRHMKIFRPSSKSSNGTFKTVL